MSMTESECIESLNGIYPEWCSEKEEYEMAQVAISALEEVQQYRAIGTVKELLELKEKATEKKPIETELFMCPKCNSMLTFEKTNRICRKVYFGIDLGKEKE